MTSLSFISLITWALLWAINSLCNCWCYYCFFYFPTKIHMDRSGKITHLHWCSKQWVSLHNFVTYCTRDKFSLLYIPLYILLYPLTLYTRIFHEIVSQIPHQNSPLFIMNQHPIHHFSFQITPYTLPITPPLPAQLQSSIFLLEQLQNSHAVLKDIMRLHHLYIL